MYPLKNMSDKHFPYTVLTFQEQRIASVTRPLRAWTAVICSAVAEDTTPKRSPLRRGVTASFTGAVMLNVRPVSAQWTYTPVNEGFTHHCRENVNCPRK